MRNRNRRPKPWRHKAWSRRGAGSLGENEMRSRYKTDKTGPYRARNGVILGVIKGLAEYFNFSVFWSRVVAVGFLVFTGIWPIAGLYLLAGLLMKPEPVVQFQNDDDEEFYSSYTASRKMGLHRLKTTFDNLERRLRRLEDTVTTKEYDWERRFRQG